MGLVSILNKKVFIVFTLKIAELESENAATWERIRAKWRGREFELMEFLAKVSDRIAYGPKVQPSRDLQSLSFLERVGVQSRTPIESPRQSNPEVCRYCGKSFAPESGLAPQSAHPDGCESSATQLSGQQAL